MAIGQSEVPRTQPVGRRRRFRLSVLGLLGLVGLAAIALFVYRKTISPRVERPAIDAVFKKVSPVADGAIGKDEYGPPVTMAWTKDNTLAAFHHYLLDPETKGIFKDPTESKQPDDLSMEVYAAYTDRSLFLAFRVHDQFVDAEIEEERPELDDGVEVFIDGDGVPNDFVPNDAVLGGVRGSKEGFQIGGNAAGQQFTKSQDFTNADWKSIARLTGDGYIVEMEIPLALIDTQDGPPFAPACAGSLLNLGLAVTDNDAEVHKQMSYAYLRTARQTTSPWLGGEAAWNFAIRLVTARSLFSW
jgi:Carbohydrate family 9 binding domain-like